MLLIKAARLVEEVVAREVLNSSLDNWLGESGFSEVDGVLGV